MQKLTDLKGFQRSCFKLLWVDFFFLSKIVLFYFEVATFSYIALRAFACALRLSPHTASRPRGAPGGRPLCSETGGKGVPERRRSRESAHAEGGCGQAGGGGRAQARRRARVRSAAALLREAQRCSCSLHTVYSPARRPTLLFTAALLLLSWWGGGQGGFLCLFF